MLLECQSYVISFVCHSHVICVRSYFIYMYSYVIRRSLVCARMSSVCHSYVLVCHPYVIRMYRYLTRMYSYLIHMSVVCTRMSSVCHSYVVLPWTLATKTSTIIKNVWLYLITTCLRSSLQYSKQKAFTFSEMYFLNKVDIYPKDLISTEVKLFSLGKGLKWMTKTVHKKCTKGAQKVILLYWHLCLW